MRFLLPAVATAVILLLPSPLIAELFSVNLIDNDGPEIVGQVDTQMNTLTVFSWLDNDNAGGTAFWSPQVVELPLSYIALDSSGSVFDVPDNWDGTIDLTWGFVADQRNTDILWNESVHSAPNPNRHHGWGGGINSRGEVIVGAFDQTQWQWAPTGPSDVNTATFDSVVVRSVPEPSSKALLSVCLIGSWMRRRRK